MRLFKLADLLSHKYKIAAGATELEKKKADILRAVQDLYKASVGGLYGEILRDLTATAIDPDVKFPDKYVSEAKLGQEFLTELLNTIDVFKINLMELPFDVLRDKLSNIIVEIESQMEKMGKEVEFPNVTSLVFVGVRSRSLHENEKFKKAYYGKARKGLLQLYGMAKDILKSLNIFEGVPSAVDPNKKYRSHQRERLTGKPAELDQYDVFPFLMQYGNSYGINTQEEWALLFRDDQQLKRAIQKIVHAHNSGHYPRDAAFMRAKIDEILSKHRIGQATNAPAFEISEDQFKEQYRPKFVSPELKKERMEIAQEQADMQEFYQQKALQEKMKRDDAWQKRHLEEQEEQRKLQEEESLKNRYSSSRLEKIMKRYQ